MKAKRFQHTPQTAARAVRALYAENIARTWDQYFDHQAKKPTARYWLTSYEAAKLVQEQCGCEFRAASLALESVIPELFAEYWEALPFVTTARTSNIP